MVGLITRNEAGLTVCVVKLKDVESVFSSAVGSCSVTFLFAPRSYYLSHIGPVQRAEIHRDGTTMPYCVLCFLTHDAFKQDLYALTLLYRLTT